MWFGFYYILLKKKHFLRFDCFSKVSIDFQELNSDKQKTGVNIEQFDSTEIEIGRTYFEFVNWNKHCVSNRHTHSNGPIQFQQIARIFFSNLKE